MGDTTPTTGGGPLGRFRGKVKEVAGSVLGNRELRDEGQLLQDKAGAEQQAQREATLADQRQTEEQLAIKEEELAAERQELAAEEAAEAERKRVEADSRHAEQRIEREYTKREAAVEDQQRSQQQAATQAEVAALRERHDAEAEAARVEQAADKARRAAADLDAAQQHQSEI